jgi:transcriptional regulator with XRE-family HTH domain
LRVRLGFSTRNVAELSRRVALDRGNPEYSISHARLVQIENQESMPGIHKLFSLSAIYGVPIDELISIYVNPADATRLHASMPVPNTHLSGFGAQPGKTIPFPSNLISTARTPGTGVLDNLVQAWREAPASLLEHLNQPNFRYGFIGLADYTMYPLIRPGSVVQIEECKKIAPPAAYRTELERPLYFMETRAGFLCSWCEVQCGRLISISHPLSPCRSQRFALTEVDVIGQVTGVALRLVRKAEMIASTPNRATAG